MITLFKNPLIGHTGGEIVALMERLGKGMNFVRKGLSEYTLDTPILEDSNWAWHPGLRTGRACEDTAFLGDSDKRWHQCLREISGHTSGIGAGSEVE
jgi:hypothetical protein